MKLKIRTAASVTGPLGGDGETGVSSVPSTNLRTLWCHPSIHPFIHPSIFNRLLLFRVTANLEFIPGSIGHKVGYTLDRVPVHHRARSHTHSHTHSYTTDTLDTPISLPCMRLDWWRKPEYPEETPAARGERANSTHTEPRWESNPRPWRCEENVQTALTPSKNTTIKNFPTRVPTSVSQPIPLLLVNHV
ncbi:hypothetical protein AMELA_G00156050 [Ameiurus melas]|uniref:Uncharacterized protein n=1 Tax=Ameiurus melas TaxID=219545 RepID=A0A7J6ADK1_AMEME|nr:hypothetical protein AMELA_G00156050 [Ameiurus melas]